MVKKIPRSQSVHSTSLDTKQIFKLLELSKRVTIAIPIEEARTLRSVLATMRSRVKKKFVSLDVPFDSMSLSMLYDVESSKATFFLQEKPRKHYEVIGIVDSVPIADKEPDGDV